MVKVQGVRSPSFPSVPYCISNTVVSHPPPLFLPALCLTLASPLSVDVTAVPPPARGAGSGLQCIVGRRHPQVTIAVTKGTGGEGRGVEKI